jgi:hypothetical protein
VTSDIETPPPIIQHNDQTYSEIDWLYRGSRPSDTARGRPKAAI